MSSGYFVRILPWTIGWIYTDLRDVECQESDRVIMTRCEFELLSMDAAGQQFTGH